MTSLPIEGAEALLKIASWLLPGPASKLCAIAETALDDAANLWAQVAPLLHTGQPIPQEHLDAAQAIVARQEQSWSDLAKANG